MTNHIEDFSISELATLAKEIVPDYTLQIEGEIVDIDEEITGMYDAADETSEFYRQRILSCLYTIADILEYQEPEGEGYRPMGFRGSWMDE